MLSHDLECLARATGDMVGADEVVAVPRDYLVQLKLVLDLYADSARAMEDATIHPSAKQIYPPNDPEKRVVRLADYRTPKPCAVTPDGRPDGSGESA